jgi:hypothetical protein
VSQGSQGSSLPVLLTIVFVVLKLVDKIDWPWVWVLSPLWIPLAIALVFGLIGLAFLGLAKSLARGDR